MLFDAEHLYERLDNLSKETLTETFEFINPSSFLKGCLKILFEEFNFHRFRMGKIDLFIELFRMLNIKTECFGPFSTLSEKISSHFPGSEILAKPESDIEKLLKEGIERILGMCPTEETKRFAMKILERKVGDLVYEISSERLERSETGSLLGNHPGSLLGNHPGSLLGNHPENQSGTEQNKLPNGFFNGTEINEILLRDDPDEFQNYLVRHPEENSLKTVYYGSFSNSHYQLTLKKFRIFDLIVFCGAVKCYQLFRKWSNEIRDSFFSELRSKTDPKFSKTVERMVKKGFGVEYLDDNLKRIKDDPENVRIPENQKRQFSVLEQLREKLILVHGGTIKFRIIGCSDRTGEMLETILNDKSNFNIDEFNNDITDILIGLLEFHRNDLMSKCFEAKPRFHLQYVMTSLVLAGIVSFNFHGLKALDFFMSLSEPEYHINFIRPIKSYFGKLEKYDRIDFIREVYNFLLDSKFTFRFSNDHQHIPERNLVKTITELFIAIDMDHFKTFFKYQYCEFIYDHSLAETVFKDFMSALNECPEQIDLIQKWDEILRFCLRKRIPINLPESEILNIKNETNDSVIDLKRTTLKKFKNKLTLRNVLEGLDVNETTKAFARELIFNGYSLSPSENSFIRFI